MSGPARVVRRFLPRISEAIGRDARGGTLSTHPVEIFLIVLLIRGQNLLKEGLSADDADGRRWNDTGMTVAKRQSVVFITDW